MVISMPPDSSHPLYIGAQTILHGRRGRWLHFTYFVVAGDAGYISPISDKHHMLLEVLGIELCSWPWLSPDNFRDLGQRSRSGQRRNVTSVP